MSKIVICTKELAGKSRITSAGEIKFPENGKIEVESEVAEKLISIFGERVWIEGKDPKAIKPEIVVEDRTKLYDSAAEEIVALKEENDYLVKQNNSLKEEIEKLRGLVPKTEEENEEPSENKEDPENEDDDSEVTELKSQLMKKTKAGLIELATSLEGVKEEDYVSLNKEPLVDFIIEKTEVKE